MRESLYFSSFSEAGKFLSRIVVLAELASVKPDPRAMQSGKHCNRRLHMRQKFLLLSVLILGMSWAVAQNTSSETGAASTSSGQTTHASTGNEKTVEGCLSESNGTYMLNAKNGMMYHLSGDTSKLSEHVGHEVKITGAMNSSSSSGSGMSNGSAMSGESHTIDVTSVKHISKTCQSTGGASKY